MQLLLFNQIVVTVEIMILLLVYQEKNIAIVQVIDVKVICSTKNQSPVFDN